MARTSRSRRAVEPRRGIVAAGGYSEAQGAAGRGLCGCQWALFTLLGGTMGDDLTPYPYVPRRDVEEHHSIEVSQNIIADYTDPEPREALSCGGDISMPNMGSDAPTDKVEHVAPAEDLRLQLRRGRASMGEASHEEVDGLVDILRIECVLDQAASRRYQAMAHPAEP